MGFKDKDLNKEQLINFKLGAAIAESILAIPFIGLLIIKASFFIVVLATFALNIYLYLKLKGISKDVGRGGHILGAIAAVFSFIPNIGWIVHAVAAVVIWVEYTKLVDENEDLKKKDKNSVINKADKIANSSSKKVEKTTENVVSKTPKKD